MMMQIWEIDYLQTGKVKVIITSQLAMLLTDKIMSLQTLIMVILKVFGHIFTTVIAFH